MNSASAALVDVLEDVKQFIARPENEFIWSGWRNEAAALAAIDGYLARVKIGDRTCERDLDLLFAPTGSLQELSLSGGWADEYLVLASRYDAAKTAQQVDPAQRP